VKRNEAIIVILAVVALSSLGGAYILRSKGGAGDRTLVVSTTTSLYETGVLDAIEEIFEAENNIDLYFISVGTGLAITHAQRGDVDMILVHAPSKELAFMKSGYGVNRKIITYNFFSIIGPDDDPAGLNGLPPLKALSAIVEKGRAGEALWVSRGDDSGTHTKEKGLWSAAGFDVSSLRDEGWYREAGAGMGKTLQITEELDAYTLTDMGTYLKYSKDDLVSSEVHVGTGEELINVYSAIAVNPESHAAANFEDAIEFIGFLASPSGQGIFKTYGVESYDVALFNPAVQLLKNRDDAATAEWVEAAAFFEGSECPPEYRVNEASFYD
jgi:tungstate transport system substrate-binding protein